MRVFFPHQQKNIDVPAGATVAEACAFAGISLNAECGGHGNCGKCAVLIKKGALTMEVLACQYEVSDNMRIYTEEKSSTKILSDSVTVKPLIVDAPVIIYPVAKDALDDRPRTEHLNGLNALLPIDVSDSRGALARMTADSRYGRSTVLNILVDENDIVAIHLDHAPAESVGMAFDIGTTTIVGYLYDLNNGAYLAHHAALNAQSAFGADVLSRISASDHGHQKELTQLLARSINEVIDICAKKACLPDASIVHMVFSGNTTMLSFLLGLNPSPLGKYPFVSPVSGEQIFSCDNIKTNRAVHIECVLRSLSPVGAFVGADTTALLTAVPRSEKPVLVIDLGTNGEIALGNGESWHVCSAACGPAFEGGGLMMGMRGDQGAIESVSYENGKFNCGIIGQGPAKGICGSGIIDAVACLLNQKLINANGDFLSGDALDNHPEAYRMLETDTGKAFVLMTSRENGGADDIIITQKDIRALQNALAAIKSAVYLLLKKTKLTPSDLDACYLSGGFGNYLKAGSAKIIGLLPKDLPVKLMGDGAANGALRCMLSREELELNRRIAKNAEVIAIADFPDFNETLLRALSFEPFF